MSEPLRVALDVTPLLGPPTGIHQATAGLVGALRDEPGVEPSGYVLSGRARQVPDCGVAVRHRRWAAGLCHLIWSLPVPAAVARPSARGLAPPADLVHGTNYTVPPGPTPRLVTVHDLTPVTDPQWCPPGVRRMGRALRRAVAAGAHVHVTSRSVAAAAPGLLGADPDRVHVVPVGLAEVGPGDAVAARRLVGDGRYVLALGATEPRKGLAGLPAAVAGLDPDVRLVVAGPAGADEDALAAAVAAAGLGRRYVRLEAVDGVVRAGLLRGAAAVAYPSLREGFGLVPLEAVSVGVPVVAAAVGALPELLGDEIPLIPPGDDQALAAGLAAALESAAEAPSAAAALEPAEALESAQAPSAVLQERLAELAWPRVAAQMAAVYRRVVNG